jgi:phage baseplate assembly protein gpV
MSKIPGVVTGVVKSVEDPDQQGRVQISLPYLGGQNDSTWAPVATLMTGGGRGSWFMPEVGDEVLVAFNQEDVQHPFIIGFLWNGQDKPPSKDISTKVRRLRTVSGHQIDFDDIDGEEKITITTKGGHKILMDDTPGSGKVSISTNGGHSIKMDDSPSSMGVSIDTNGGQKVDLQDLPPSVTIQTTAQNQVIVSDVPPGITINAPTGILTISCMMATVTADSVLNVSAPMTVFDGVVQAQAVIATAVVGSAYTPAPGDTFGL